MPHMDSNPFSVDGWIEGAVIAMFIAFVVICITAVGVFDKKDEE